MTVAGDEGKRRETWREWCAPNGFGAPGRPDPRTITRAELLAMLERWEVKTARGQPVEAPTLRHWTTEGLLPGATVEGALGYQQAKYAWWIADLIMQLRHYQDGGMKTAQLRAWIRGDAHRLSRVPDWRVPNTPQLAAVDPLVPRRLPRTFSPEIIPGVARMMRQYGEERGIQFARAELHLVTTSGEALVYTVPVRPRSAELPDGGVE